MKNKLKVFEIGRFLVKKYVDKVLETSRATDRVIVIKKLVKEIIISVISVYALPFGCDDRYKDDSCDILLNVIKKIEKETIQKRRFQ